MNIDNDAVSLNISVDLNWYQLGFQFAEQKDVDQAQFLIAAIREITEWGAVRPLYQFDELVKSIDELVQDDNKTKKQLAHMMDELSERLKA